MKIEHIDQARFWAAAREFGVSAANISRIMLRQSWRHLP